MHRARVALVTTIGVAALCYAFAVADEAQQPLVTPPPPIDAPPTPSPVQAAVAAARHVRIDGPHGAIHVWIPPGFHSDVGATIVYLHGYYDDADSSYIGHRLPEQFAMSALDAMFIVAETPVAQKTPINYPSLGELLQLVEEKTGTPRGMAYTAVVGHSGAFRTIDAWLDEPLVDELVMIDSMYGNEEQIEAWMRASPRHKLVTVGEDTLIYNENLLRVLPDTLVLDRVPTSYETWPAEARTARSVYVRAQFMHMPLVTDGIVLPGLLRLLPVPLLADEPWTTPLGDVVH
ncbi:MAG TPA: hypothetical protein VGG28_20060 [Kofleriaceae bacterium]